VTNLARQVVFGESNFFVPALVVNQRAETVNKRDAATRGHILEARRKVLDFAV
jgi:hypothetical protein